MEVETMPLTLTLPPFPSIETAHASGIDVTSTAVQALPLASTTRLVTCFSHLAMSKETSLIPRVPVEERSVDAITSIAITGCT
jgi:hypothetical protein